MENTNTGWKKYKIVVAACVLFAIAAIVLAALLSVYVSRAGDARIDAENNYRAAYFELLDSMLDIETDLSKMKVASTDAMQTELMLDTAINAELAGQSLSSLVRDEYQLEPTIKFCNQLQDFAKYIVKKIDREQPLTDKDYESLDDLHEAALELGRRLAAMGDGMREDGYYFIEAIGEDDPFRDIVDGVEDSAVQYPSLIYDGPFSDGLEDPEPHALKGEEVTREQAAQKAKEYLSEYDVTEVEFTAEANGYPHLDYDRLYRLMQETVNGQYLELRDLLALGVKPGPAVGRLLAAALEQVVEERLPNRRDALLGWLQTHLNTQEEP